MHEPISKRLVYKDELKAVYRVEYPIIEIDEYHNLLVIDTETKSCATAFPVFFRSAKRDYDNDYNAYVHSQKKQ